MLQVDKTQDKIDDQTDEDMENFFGKQTTKEKETKDKKPKSDSEGSDYKRKNYLG